MLVLPLQFEIVHFNSYMAVAVYMHYFTPGSLRIKTKTQILSWDEFDNVFGEKSLPFENTRRWLVETGSPFPGYCRAPGTGKCIETLCNCMVLQQLWGERQKTYKMTHLKDNTVTESVSTTLLTSTTVKAKKLKSTVETTTTKH